MTYKHKYGLYCYARRQWRAYIAAAHTVNELIQSCAELQQWQLPSCSVRAQTSSDYKFNLLQLAVTLCTSSG
eukprot:8340-Heterococcus_DN1.PRE.2